MLGLERSLDSRIVTYADDLVILCRADPQLLTRGVVHHHAATPGIDGGFSVPLAPFIFTHGGPRIDTPPPALGQHNEEIFAELGVSGERATAGKHTRQGKAVAAE